MNMIRSFVKFNQKIDAHITEQAEANPAMTLQFAGRIVIVALLVIGLGATVLATGSSSYGIWMFNASLIVGVGPLGLATLLVYRALEAKYNKKRRAQLKEIQENPQVALVIERNNPNQINLTKQQQFGEFTGSSKNSVHPLYYQVNGTIN